MQISRKSPVTGILRTREIDVTERQLDAWQSGTTSIQNAMPHLSDGDREFIMTGITEDEWNELFGEEDE